MDYKNDEVDRFEKLSVSYDTIQAKRRQANLILTG